MLSTPANDPQDTTKRLGLTRCANAPFALPSDVSSCLFKRINEDLSSREKRTREFNAGRWCAANVLGELKVTGEVGVAEDRSPIWPTGITGSISHSDLFVWCLAGRTDSLVSIGIDTEPVVDEATLKHLRNEILSDQEMQIGLDAGYNEFESFTAIFSAKECFYKCAYQLQPVFIGFHDVEVVAMDNQTIRLEMSSDSPNQIKELRTMQVEYLIQDQNVFTACWLRQKESE